MGGSTVLPPIFSSPFLCCALSMVKKMMSLRVIKIEQLASRVVGGSTVLPPTCALDES